MTTRTLLLDTLDQKYAIEGRSYYARGLVSANPADWIELHGNFLFSQPRTETDYRASAAGVFGESNPPRFFEAINESLIAAAKQPHVSGAFSVELRPAARLRLLESFLTDRYHTASRLGLGATDRLELNYNQNQFDVLVDALPSLTLRGGHRYVFGDARTRAPGLSFGLPLQNTDLERNVLLAGLAYRPAARLSVHVDSEAGWSNNVYFRTSLRDYQRIRARATFQALASLALTANFGLLNNDSPTPGGGYLVRSRDAGLSVAWTPAAGKRVRLIGDYVRSTFRSEIDYLVPQELSRELSRYRDYAHQATALVDVAIPAIGGRAPRLSAGGSLFHTSGSRPTRYYQPLARFTAPIARHLEANFEWRWYAMSEAFYVFEGFRAHQLIFSLRIL
ncbi:MAG: hypothetical protein HYS04_03495 [Acidobacteria bacterium]|nr:hypothetical protein [Acidobacteriota bacterium]